jgi:cell division GTPase FtsZ
MLHSAAEVIYENVDENANIIFGALVDEKLTNGEVRPSYLCGNLLCSLSAFLSL